jgi:hypothetical protein
MQTQFKIDQAKSFEGMVFVSCEPKRKFRSDEQEFTKDGQLGKWEIQVLAAIRNGFGQLTNEVLKVGIASRQNPAEGVAPFTPVELADLEVGVIEKTKKLDDGTERIIGVNVWFRCSEILNVAETVVRPATAA